MINYTVIESEETKQHFHYHRIEEMDSEYIIRGRELPLEEWTIDDATEVIGCILALAHEKYLHDQVPELIRKTCKEIGLNDEKTDKFIQLLAKQLNEEEYF